MVKRKDDGTQSGSNDKAHAEGNDGTPPVSGHPTGRAGSGQDGNDRRGVKTIAGAGVVAASSATSASAASVPSPENDTIFGTSNDDTIDALAGDDRIFGQDGNDTLLGSEGNDTISGGQGNDSLVGGPGGDTLGGNSGLDTVVGGLGDDRIDGGAGDDLLQGDAGSDTILGGDGNDTIEGGTDGDTLDGGGGDDTFVGATPGDIIDGGSGTNTLDLSQPGIGAFDISPDPGDATSGTIDFRDADGNDTGSATFSNIENIVPCFTPGTRIATPRGECVVEDLRVGDRVITRDNGLQEIRWIGKRALTRQEMRAAPHLRPVLVRAGALGRGLPIHDMLVSPQHRLLLTSERAALYFEEREVLASAKHLIEMDGIDQTAICETTYVHFMFDQHEVVLSNGAWSESFQPGEQVLDGLGLAQRSEIFDLFPELRDVEGITAYQAARRSLKRHEARLLVA